LGVLVACAPAMTTATPLFAPPLGAQIPESEIPRLQLEEAKAAFEAGTAVFVDVRSATSYAAAHIPGALSIPLADLEARLSELDPNQWIITYCT
ncbi:MAG: rhodanese-like domain-containing protein, partial [Anaerolineae bacterium]